MSINKIIIRGKETTVAAVGALRGDNKNITITTSLVPEAIYELGGSDRDIQQEHTIELDDKLLEFTFDDGTTWMCDAATLHELYPEAENLQRGSEGFRIPATVQDASTERGIFGEIAAKLLSVFAKKAIGAGVKAIAERLEKQHLTEKDNPEKSREGLNFLNKDFTFEKIDDTSKIPTTKPFLLFIHGTNSDTKGAYGDLLQADVWNYIHNTYGKNVLAFEHRTLTQSALQNAVALAQQLPDGAELHIISHSRGGLIGDILCRYSSDSNDKTTGFSTANIELLTKEKRDSDIECIRTLNEIYSKKKIKVKKFIRVACPAAGTKLASKRLDQIFNVLYNLLGREANDIAVILKELIAETIKTKENTNVLPGIEAMGPESPFIKILNDRADDIAIDGSSLAVISGNGKLSVSFRGLFIILGKLFYMQRNDLVVNTDSMYLGAKRKDAIQYFFDEGKTVDHITYFKNNKTREAIAFALKTEDGKTIPGFTTVKSQYDVPASDRGILPSIEHGELKPDQKIPTGEKPIVILLPGIMGSNLSLKDDKIWLAYLHTITGGLKDLLYTGDPNITATSLIETSYKRLAENLSPTYDVVIYPFDWRRSLKECSADFNDTIIKLLKFNKPIKIIGHSMGGVLVRDFIIYHDDTWQQLNASKDFMLLFLGSPLGGSYRIPAVLFGNDPIINSLNMLDRSHTKKELISMFAKFPGILSLLPLSTGVNERGESTDFADVKTWEKMRDALDDSMWPIPSTSDLDNFREYRNTINNKKEFIDYSNMLYIAGKDKHTPCDYYNDEILPGRELVFLYTGEGDQSVTWETGIPQKMTEANNVYYVNATHGALANEPDIFPGIQELLAKGNTTLLSKVKPLVRGEEKLFRVPDVYNFDLSERGIENAVFGITERNEQVINQIPLSVSVSHGDLAYASFPVLAGHFLNDGIMYAEKSIDKLMNGTLTARHTLGIYPGEIGTSAALATNMDESDFPGAIIIGLGEPGTLTASQLTLTVEQAISKYLLDINNQPDNGKDIGISALIIGCGYGGLTVEGSLKAIIEGVNNANSKVSDLYKNNILPIQYIEFIELYEDRALSCMYALRKIENKENSNYNIRIGNRNIKILFGSKKRMPADFLEEWWRRITIKSKQVKENSNEVPALIFSASTGDAREEEKELFSSTPLIDLFVDEISAQNAWKASYATTLFELMIPNDFKDRLKKKGSIMWILDKKAAAYPWELLQDNSTNAKPLCVNAGMIRQLSTKEYRININRVANDKALVIADPMLNGFVTQLGGAKLEGELVDKSLEKFGYSKKTLINKSASEVVEALFSDEYKIIHLAGHGFFNPHTPERSGMVIGKEIFLTPFDIEQMETVPELVFINCCHLGKIDPGQEKFFTNKYKLAANLGTQLIQMGVKAVIAAGWAVNDAAAHDFADAFYTRMFAGYNFGDAIKEARNIVYDKHHNNNNTWGAYQCYGDPFYKLINRSSSKKNTTKQYVMGEEVVIDLVNLKNDLDTRNYTCQEALDTLKEIIDAKDTAEINDADTAQLEAMIYYELGEYSKAVVAFDDLRGKEKATFTVAALEKFCNVRCKKYMEDFKAGGNAGDLLKNIDAVIDELNMLLNIKRTTERNNLLGSSFKRKGYLSSGSIDKITFYKQAASCYYESCYTNKDKKYAFKNWAALKCLLALSDVQTEESPDLYYNDKLIEDWKKELEQSRNALKQLYLNMDYWDLIEDATIDLTFLFLDYKQAQDDKNWNELEKKYKRIWKKEGSRGKKKAEVENLEILADVAALSTIDQGILLKNKLTELKEKLEKEIENS